MIFHTGKIYNMPKNFYFYKPNQPRLLMEYCKKINIPEKKFEKYRSIKIDIPDINNEIENNSCIEYCKNIIIFPENDEEKISDDDTWVDMKKFL